jgi:hypothetical protein
VCERETERIHKWRGWEQSQVGRHTEGEIFNPSSPSLLPGMPPPPPAGHPPLQHSVDVEDQNAASGLRHGSQDQWLVAYYCSESDASEQAKVPYWYNPVSCGEDGLPRRSWDFPQPSDSHQSPASSGSVRHVHQFPPLNSAGGGGGMVSETRSQANAGCILKKTDKVLLTCFEEVFPRTTGV